MEKRILGDRGDTANTLLMGGMFGGGGDTLQYLSVGGWSKLENIATLRLHLASLSLPDSQLS